jgi:hypothetical protein
MMARPRKQSLESLARRTETRIEALLIGRRDGAITGQNPARPAPTAFSEGLISGALAMPLWALFISPAAKP